MTPASSEAEAGLIFPNLLLYHLNYMQVLRKYIQWGTSKTINTNSQGTSKTINKVPWLVFLRAYQDDQDIWAYFLVLVQSHIHAWSLLLCSSLKLDPCLTLLPCSSLKSDSCLCLLAWHGPMSDSCLKPTFLSWPNVRFLSIGPQKLYTSPPFLFSEQDCTCFRSFWQECLPYPL